MRASRNYFKKTDMTDYKILKTKLNSNVFKVSMIQLYILSLIGKTNKMVLHLKYEIIKS